MNGYDLKEISFLNADLFYLLYSWMPRASCLRWHRFCRECHIVVQVEYKPKENGIFLDGRNVGRLAAFVDVALTE